MSFSDWTKTNNQWFGLFGFLVGIAGLALGYFSTPKGSISYQGKSIAIVDAGHSTGLRVTDISGRPITDNAYALEVAIWNSGDLTLGQNSDRVRAPLSIRLPDTAEILGASIQRSNIVGPALRATQTNRLVKIDWADFDPGDGLKLLSAYTSSQTAAIRGGGQICSDEDCRRGNRRAANGFHGDAPSALGFVCLAFDRRV
jgi:hypothetical protein